MNLGSLVGTLQDEHGNRLVIGAGGASLVLADDPTTPDPGTDPGPIPDTPPHGHRRVLWHHGWAGPRLGTWPDDVRARLTTVCLGMSQSARGGTGTLTTPPGVTRQEVQALVADGVDVFTGIGGSGADGITVRTGDHVEQLVASVLAQRDALGITGITWDIETKPGTSWLVDPVVDASHRLLDAGLRISIWSATWDGRLEAWGAVAHALGERLDHWQRSLYGFDEQTDSRLVGITTGSVRDLRRYTSRDDQIVLCFAPVDARPDGSLRLTSAPLARSAVDAARELAPLAGWGVWEDYRDAQQSWAMTRALVAA